MGQFLLADSIYAISKTLESAINTPKTLSADFETFRAKAMAPSIPVPEIVSDREEIGDGNEFEDDSRLYYWSQNEYSWNAKLNTEAVSRIFLRALGGTVTDAVVTATKSWDHSVVMQTRVDGVVPKYSTLVHKIGGSDFLFPSMAVNRFEVSQGGAGEPQATFSLVNTGNHMRVADISPAIVFADPPKHNYMHGAATAFTFNDGSLKDMAATARVRNIALSFSNNLIVGNDARSAGDPFLTTADRGSGAYVRVLNRGTRTSSAQFKLMLDENLTEYGYIKNGTIITSCKVVFGGQKITGTTADYFEFEWNIPKSKAEVLGGDTEAEKGAVSITFGPKRDSVTKGLITGRVRNDQATMV
jgi:hypothetical protein